MLYGRQECKSKALHCWRRNYIKRTTTNFQTSMIRSISLSASVRLARRRRYRQPYAEVVRLHIQPSQSPQEKHRLGNEPPGRSGSSQQTSKCRIATQCKGCADVDPVFAHRDTTEHTSEPDISTATTPIFHHLIVSERPRKLPLHRLGALYALIVVCKVIGIIEEICVDSERHTDEH